MFDRHDHEELQAYSGFRDLVYRIARQITRNPADADEIVQEVRLRLWKSRPSQDRPLRSWIVTVAKRAAIDVLRRRDTPVVHSSSELSKNLAAAPCEAERREQIELATSGLIRLRRRLTTTQLAVVVLCDYCGLKSRQVAARLDLTEVNVRKTLSRAHGEVESLLAELGGRLSPPSTTTSEENDIVAWIAETLLSKDHYGFEILFVAPVLIGSPCRIGVVRRRSDDRILALSFDCVSPARTPTNLSSYYDYDPKRRTA